jgi:aminomethyltransferase
VTNRTRDLRLGQVRYTPIAQPDGTLLDDSTIYFLRPDHLQMVHGLRPDLEWFQEVARDFGVTLTDITETRVVASLQGPASYRVLKSLTTANLAPMRWFHFTYATVGGITCRVSRTGYHGELGYEIAAPPEQGERLWQQLMEAGQAEGIMPAGFGAVDPLRLEKGYLTPLVDFDAGENRVNVLESGLGWAVDFAKDDFVGKAALEQARDEGLRQAIVYFDSDGDGIEIGDAVLDGESRVGVVLSGAVTPTVGRFIGFARVAPPRQIGDTLAVQSAAGPVPIRIARKGLYDPENDRLRARPR